MKPIPIIHTTNYALSLLAKYRNGIVHSVYERTVNLAVENHLLAIQTLYSPISPISFIAKIEPMDLSKLSISKGQPVIFNQNSIMIISDGVGIEFGTSDAELHSTGLKSSLNAKDILVIKERLREIVMRNGNESFATIFSSQPKDIIDIALLTAKKYVDQTCDLFSKAEYSNAAKIIAKLIGLGIGLTPGGDDFLCGMLAGIHLSDNEKHEFYLHLRAEIEHGLHRTNDISRAFLKCALDKEYALAVTKLATLPPTFELEYEFKRIGHSSGMDTLCGIYFSLCLLI